MDAFTAKHLDLWIAGAYAYDPEVGERAKAAIVKHVTEHPSLIDPNERARSWREILDMSGFRP